jgi:DAACS family dicarboxylate/amino acid:cation (Na+ or H+) symporter
MSEPDDARRSTPLHTKIMIGLILGGAAGLAVNLVLGGPDHNAGVAKAVAIADPLGKVFLRLIFMVVVPLVVSALVLGVAGLGDVRRLGRVGLRTLALTALFSFSAVGLGLVLVNTIQPGKALTAEQSESLRKQYSQKSDDAVQKARQAKSLSDTLLDVIPENPLQEMVGAVDGSSKGNGMLAVMFFSLMVGVAATVAGDKCQPLIALLEALFEICMVIIGFAMRLAPYAVACLVFSITARLGFDIVRTLGWFVATVLLGLGLQMVVVYSLAVRFIGGRSPIDFFSKIREAMVTAFGTSSSNATLPTAIKTAEQDLGLPKEIANFVLTIGATGNQNGTALYEGVVVLFLAQVFGIDLTLTQQLMVVLMSVLAGIGTAGVPGGSLPLIVVVLQTVNVPGQAIGVILGIDRVLDMCRTVLNVTGDLAIATCVANWEGAEPDEIVEMQPRP